MLLSTLLLRTGVAAVMRPEMGSAAGAAFGVRAPAAALEASEEGAPLKAAALGTLGRSSSGSPSTPSPGGVVAAAALPASVRR